MKGVYSPEEHKKNIETFAKIVNSLKGSRGEQVERLFKDFDNKFFTSPASSHYYAFPGGLLKHSLEVANNIVHLANALYPDKHSRDTLFFVGLTHDIGKLGNKSYDYYIANPNERARQYVPYIINSELKPFLTVSQRTLYLLQEYKVDVSAEEYQAILLKDGQYIDSNQPYKLKEEPLALLLHFADVWSART